MSTGQGFPGAVSSVPATQSLHERAGLWYWRSCFPALGKASSHVETVTVTKHPSACRHLSGLPTALHLRS